jgi:hypothetical protein
MRDFVTQQRELGHGDLLLGVDLDSQYLSTLTNIDVEMLKNKLEILRTEGYLDILTIATNAFTYKVTPPLLQFAKRVLKVITAK